MTALLPPIHCRKTRGDGSLLIWIIQCLTYWTGSRSTRTNAVAAPVSAGCESESATYSTFWPAAKPSGRFWILILTWRLATLPPASSTRQGGSITRHWRHRWHPVSGFPFGSMPSFRLLSLGGFEISERAKRSTSRSLACFRRKTPTSSQKADRQMPWSSPKTAISSNSWSCADHPLGWSGLRAATAPTLSSKISSSATGHVPKNCSRPARLWSKSVSLGSLPSRLSAGCAISRPLRGRDGGFYGCRAVGDRLCTAVDPPTMPSTSRGSRSVATAKTWRGSA